MTEEWLEEGLRQFRWGLAWSRLAYLLESAGAGRSQAGGPARDQVKQCLTDFLAPDWFPGVKKALSELVAELHAKGWADLRSDLVARLEALLQKEAPNFVEAGAAPRDPAVGAAKLEQVFRGCLRKARGQGVDPPREAAPVPALSPAAYARHWLRQAGALRRWLQLLPALQGEADPRLRRLPELVRQCRAAAPGKKAGGPSTEVAQLLRECGQALELFEQHLPALTPRAAQEQQRVLKWFQSEIANAPRSWPPLALARLQTEVGNAGDKRLAEVFARLADGPEPDGADPAVSDPPAGAGLKGRLHLALHLVRQLDAPGQEKQPLPPEAWGQLQTFLDQLLLGTGKALKLHREAGGAPGWADCQPCPPDDPRRGVVETGLLLLKPKGDAVVLRKARLLVPRAAPPVLACLERLLARLDRADAVLSELCRKVGGELRRQETPERWWQSLSEEGKGDVWRLAVRAVGLATLRPEYKSAVVELLHEFGSVGVTLVDPPAPPRQPATGGPWFVQADPGTKAAVLAPAAWGRGVALRGPDGTLTAPAVWLRVPGAWAEARPLVRCLVESEPLLAGLKRRAPDWTGWEEFNDALWSLAYAPGPGQAGEAETARRAFLAVYARAQEETSEADGFRELGRRLYRCLTGPLGIAFTPALDEQTLRPNPLRAAPTDGSRCRWAVGDRPLGEVLSVEGLGKADEPPLLTVSTGPLPAEVGCWLKLPPPAFAGLAGDPARVAGHPLTRWYREVQALPWQPHQAAARVQQSREAFGRWLAGDEGLAWFDRLAHDLTRPGPAEAVEAARDWWQVLSRQGWCRCYPPLDPTTGTVLGWPTDLRTPAPGIRWEFSDRVPLRQPTGEVAFAPSSERARGTYSLGPRRPGGELDAAAALREDLPAEFQAEADLVAAVEALLVRVRDGVLTGQPTSSPARLALPVLEALERLCGRSPDGSPEHLGVRALLARLRVWCAAVGLRVLPDGWQPGEPPPPEGEGVRRQVSFSAGGARGSASLRQFGLRGAKGEVLRPAEVLTSAGPPPAGYDELLARLEAVGDPRTSALAESLRGWPAAAVEGGRLDYAAGQFWIDFWGQLDESFQKARREAFDQLEGILRGLLENEYRLSVFYPDRLQSYPPEWVETTPGSSVVTGRVTRVVRPGLCVNPKELRLRAIVEAE